MFCAGRTKFGQNGRGLCGEDAMQIGWGPMLTLPSGSTGIDPNMDPVSNYQMNSVIVIDKNGNAYAAGDNTYGKLGTGAAPSACNSSFRRVQLPSGVTAEAVANGDEYSAFILGSDGNLYAMGRNNEGQLGNGTTTDSNVPVRVLIPRESTLYY